MQYSRRRAKLVRLNLAPVWNVTINECNNRSHLMAKFNFDVLRQNYKWSKKFPTREILKMPDTEYNYIYWTFWTVYFTGDSLYYATVNISYYVTMCGKEERKLNNLKHCCAIQRWNCSYLYKFSFTPFCIQKRHQGIHVSCVNE